MNRPTSWVSVPAWASSSSLLAAISSLPAAACSVTCELKDEFRGRITLHGAVDVQGFLQRATPDEIATEVNRLMDEVGDGGGFIIGPSHHIQPDTPLENVLAFYSTVAGRRGVEL